MSSSQEIVYDTIKTLQDKGLLGKIHQDSGDNYVLSCPFVDNHGGRREQNTPSFGIHRTDGKWHCFSCERGGQSIYSLFSALTGASKEEAELTLGKPRVDSNSVLEALSALKAGEAKPELMTGGLQAIPIFQSKEALDFMVSKRGIPEKVLKQCGVRYYPEDFMPARMGELRSGVKGRRIIFDIIHNGQYVGYSSRSMGDDQPKYYRPIRRVNLTVYNPISVSPQTHSYVVACEGEISCLAAIREGLPAVCTFGANISYSQAAFLSGFQTAFLLFDGDEAGAKGVAEAIKAYGASCNFRSVILPAGKDPASLEPGWGSRFKILLDKKKEKTDVLSKLENSLRDECLSLAPIAS